MLEPFIAAFLLGFLSEIADKTQLVILGLALKYKSGFKVFAGALLGHALMDGIAIILGIYFGVSLSSAISSGMIKNIVGGIFIALGLWAFIKIYFKKSKKEKNRILGKAPLIVSFLTILLSEFGDKTQVASGLLGAKYLFFIPVFLGFSLALALAIGLNVFIGRRFAERIPRKAIKIITGVLFILFGIFSLLS